MSGTEYDLNDDAPRYVVEALAAVRDTKGKDATVDLSDLAANYIAPRPSNITELKKDFARESAQPNDPVDDHEFKEYLIYNAISDVNYQNNDLLPYDPVILGIENDDNNFRLADDVDISKLKLHREPLLPKTVPTDLFAPGGKWANNSRSYDPAKLGQLRESMQATGWSKHLPAIGDERTKDAENPVIIVGHRRIAVAEELGIDPVIKWVDFGDGPAAEAAKIALAIASNTGAENISPADRKKIAEDLYDDGTKFTMAEIGKILRVSTMTVSRDLSGLTSVKPPPPERGGRPKRKKGTPKPPAPTPIRPNLTSVSTEPEPEQPEPIEPEPIPPVEKPVVDLDTGEDADAPQDIDLWLIDVAANLGHFADYLESIEATEREPLVDKRLPALNKLGEQLERVFKALGLDDEEAKK
jgi:hypothetical protein